MESRAFAAAVVVFRLDGTRHTVLLEGFSLIPAGHGKSRNKQQGKGQEYVFHVLNVKIWLILIMPKAARTGGVRRAK